MIPKLQELATTPEMLARREEAQEEIRKLAPSRDITNPVDGNVKCRKAARW